MKKIIVISAALFLCITSFAQTINWESLKPEQKHMINLNTGVDYATSFGLGYGYKLNMRVLKTDFPVVLQTQASIPAGENLVDDFKSKVGGQVRVYKTGNFSATVSVLANFRGHKTDLVKMQSFGGEFTGVFGYYKPTWFAAGEFGFDKAIATHIKNSDLMKEYFPEVQDGWYVPTAGNFNAGLQAGYTIKTVDVYAKGGLIWDQSFNRSAFVPYYLQLGVNKRF